MRKAVMLFSLALFNAFLLACAGPQDMIFEFVKNTQKMPEGEHATLPLTQADNGKEIQVEDGTYIEITLPVDPSAGYSWNIIDSPYAAHVVVRVGQPEYVPEKPFSQKTGTVRQITYRFQALGLGTDTVKMELLQNKEVMDTFTITVESLSAK